MSSASWTAMSATSKCITIPAITYRRATTSLPPDMNTNGTRIDHSPYDPPPNPAAQRTRRERRGCHRCVPCAGSLYWVVTPLPNKAKTDLPTWIPLPTAPPQSPPPPRQFSVSDFQSPAPLPPHAIRNTQYAIRIPFHASIHKSINPQIHQSINPSIHHPPPPPTPLPFQYQTENPSKTTVPKPLRELYPNPATHYITSIMTPITC